MAQRKKKPVRKKIATARGKLSKAAKPPRKKAAKRAVARSAPAKKRRSKATAKSTAVRKVARKPPAARKVVRKATKRLSAPGTVAPRVPSAPAAQSGALLELDLVLNKPVEAGLVPGVVALAADDRGVFYKAAFGVRSIDKPDPMTPDSVFRIASMTKAVTSVAAMMLHEEGAFQLNDPIVQWLPEFQHTPVYVAGSAQRPVTELAPGEVRLDVVFTPAAGQKYDDRYGPSTRLQVSSTPPGLLLDGAGDDVALDRVLRLDPTVTEGVLHVTAHAASCDADPAIEYPACHLNAQDWGVPVRLVEGAATTLTLPLHG